MLKLLQELVLYLLHLLDVSLTPLNLSDFLAQLCLLLLLYALDELLFPLLVLLIDLLLLHLDLLLLKPLLPDILRLHLLLQFGDDLALLLHLKRLLLDQLESLVLSLLRLQLLHQPCLEYAHLPALLDEFLLPLQRHLLRMSLLIQTLDLQYLLRLSPRVLNLLEDARLLGLKQADAVGKQLLFLVELCLLVADYSLIERATVCGDGACSLGRGMMPDSTSTTTASYEASFCDLLTRSSVSRVFYKDFYEYCQYLQ